MELLQILLLVCGMLQVITLVGVWTTLTTLQQIVQQQDRVLLRLQPSRPTSNPPPTI